MNHYYSNAEDMGFIVAMRRAAPELLSLAREAEKLRATRSCNLVSPATTYPAIVGAVLTSMRVQSGATADDVAKAMHVKAATWRRIERGGSVLSLDRLAQFAAHAGVEPSLVLGRADKAREVIEAMGVYVSPGRLSAKDIAEQRLVMLAGETVAKLVTS